MILPFGSLFLGWKLCVCLFSVVLLSCCVFTILYFYCFDIYYYHEPTKRSALSSCRTIWLKDTNERESCVFHFSCVCVCAGSFLGVYRRTFARAFKTMKIWCLWLECDVFASLFWHDRFQPRLAKEMFRIHFGCVGRLWQRLIWFVWFFFCCAFTTINKRFNTEVTCIPNESSLRYTLVSSLLLLCLYVFVCDM